MDMVIAPSESPLLFATPCRPAAVSPLLKTPGPDPQHLSPNRSQQTPSIGMPVSSPPQGAFVVLGCTPIDLSVFISGLRIFAMPGTSNLKLSMVSTSLLSRKDLSGAFAGNPA